MAWYTLYGYVWPEDYLYQKTQTTGVSGVLSFGGNCRCGEKQGSSPRPLLFILYINDLNNSKKICFILYIIMENVCNTFMVYTEGSEEKSVEKRCRMLVF